MPGNDHFRPFDLIDWLSIGVLVVSAAIVGYIVLMLVTQSG
jgi:hypothetical protein